MSLIDSQSPLQDKTEPIEAPLLHGVQEIASGLASALKASRIHGFASPTVGTVLDRLHAKLQAFFESSGEVSLALHVLPDALCFKGHTVLELGTSSGDPAFAAMIQAGIRQFTFLDALTRQELGEFVELLLRAPADATSYDLATLLWERNFDQISYLVVESFAEDLASPRFNEELNRLLTAVAAELAVDTVRIARLSEDDLRIKPDSPFSDLNSARTPENIFESIIEEDRVAEVLAAGEDDFLGSRLVNIFLRLAQDAPAEKDRLNFEAKLAGLWEDELLAGRLESARRAVGLLAQWKVRMEGFPAGKTAQGVLNRIAGCPSLAKLPELVEDPPSAARPLVELFLALGPRTLPVAYKMAASWSNPAARTQMLNCVGHLARQDASFLVHELGANLAASWRVCVPALGSVADSAAEAALVEAYKRGTVEIRTAIFKAIGGRTEPFARGLLVNALSAEDPGLRALAFRGLGTLADRRAADALFASAEKQLPGEKRGAVVTAILSSLLQSDSARALALLERVVQQAATYPQAVLIEAARALGTVRSPTSAQLLRELASASGEREVVKECDFALQRIQHAS